MSEFIIPPCEITESDNPVIFLAGPVQGTDDWQRQAGEYIIDRSPRPVSVISPRGAQELYHSPSPWLDSGEQTPWEKRHLKLARDTGILAMWMTAQTHDTPGRVFAQTSRIEFGRIAGWMDFDARIRFIFGIDPSYAGGNSTYFREVCNEFHLPVHDSLEKWSSAIVEQLS